jgi:hypothetical protein
VQPPNWTRQTSSFLYLATMQLGTLSDQEDCARALGLRGAEAQVAVNTSGSLRLKQITMPHAMKHPLQHLVCYSTTNDKCVLEILLLSTPSTLKSGRFNSSDVLPQSPAGNGTLSPGRAAPVKQPVKSDHRGLSAGRGCGMTTCSCNTLQLAIAIVSHGELGSVETGLHFYWLARAFLQPDRVRDWQLPADRRFKQTITGVGQVREWSKTEGGPARRRA